MTRAIHIGDMARGRRPTTINVFMTVTLGSRAPIPPATTPRLYRPIVRHGGRFLNYGRLMAKR